MTNDPPSMNTARRANALTSVLSRWERKEQMPNPPVDGFAVANIQCRKLGLKFDVRCSVFDACRAEAFGEEGFDVSGATDRSMNKVVSR
jgi:hypothetical protein